MTKTRARALVSGKVQGVFFRAAAAETAEQAGLTGFVRNLRDGRVEVIFEGDKDTVQRLIDWCHEGPPSARVDSVEVFWEPATGEFTGFSARSTF